MKSSVIICDTCKVRNTENNIYCTTCNNILQNRILDERYYILQVVGQGGMGTVYKAEDIKLGHRPVAVKEIRNSIVQSEEEFDLASKELEQEALLLAKLSHPNLPSIYDHFKCDGRWYLVMEYISGVSLSQCLRNIPDKRLPIKDTINIGIKLSIVLNYLHQQDSPIVFGDLKPDNIMITDQGSLYLIDFGIARIFEKALSNKRKFVSLGYSAPEQYENVYISPQADIYSLGVTLHEMLSGRHPTTREAHFHPLRLGNALWKLDLETIVMSMLNASVKDRPQNMVVVKQALQRVMDLCLHEENLSTNSQLQDTEMPQGELRLAPTTQSSRAISLSSFISRQDIAFSHPTNTLALAWSPDGSKLAIADQISIRIYIPSEKDTRNTEALELSFYWYFSELKGTQYNKNFTSSVTDTSEYSKGSYLYSGQVETLRSWYTVGTGPFAAHQQAAYRQATKQVTNGQEEGIETCEYVAMAWSPDSTHLIIAGTLFGRNLLVLNTISEGDYTIYAGHEKGTEMLAWSPNGQYIASSGIEHTVIVQEVETSRWLGAKMHSGSVTAVAWSPDSRFLASASTDGSIHVWETATGRDVTIYKYHIEYVYDIKWTPNGNYIISCGADCTVQIWDAKTGVRQYLLEAHTSSVRRIAFLDHGRFLISVSRNYLFYIWNTDNWTLVASFTDEASLSRQQLLSSVITFHPTAPILALSVEPGFIHFYELDVTKIQKETGIQYTNAKVVLLGDSGVGKSGLGLVLSRNHFIPTESTHGRTVWTLSKSEDRLADGRREIREILLWDFAGQPGYRLIHQLYLHEVSVALIVFDGHSETDPFAGILHWVRALRTAQRVLGNRNMMKIFLVLARIDRGGKRVSRRRINELLQQLELDDYYETSAKEGKNIAALTRGINQAINWVEVPKVASTALFQSIREFLVEEKRTGYLLSTIEDLYRAYQRIQRFGNNDVSAEFITGIKLLDSAGFVCRLNFGNLVLLQPELLDSYASALVNAVRDEPDGLGNIFEEAVLTGNFYIPAAKRITDYEREKLLLIAMVQDLLFYEIVLREQSEDGPYLVFPSESTRENPDLPNPENASTVFTFEGPVLNIYTTLAVRLSHSGLFVRKELWKNAIIYDTKVGGTCGIWLEVIEDGKGALTLFFDEYATNETRFYFEEYVQVHLHRKASPESVTSRRIHKCECGFVASDQLIRMRAERGFKWFNCPVCGEQVDLRDYRERLRGTSLSRVPEMDTAADLQRALAMAQSTVQGKQETKDFDVFLCYNIADRLAVINIANGLKEQGFLPWLDEWELQPGLPWQRSLELQMDRIRSAAVFVGDDGIGPWQKLEIETLLRQFVKRECPIIPVILSNAPVKPDLPIFLGGLRWVDFRKQTSNYALNPMELLIWGISGEKR